MGSTPEPPKPLETNRLAGMQQQENTRAANQNASLNRLNQTDQFGNTIRYRQTGRDASGNPTYSVNQSMGQFGRSIDRGMLGLSRQFFSGANNYLNNPLDVNAETEKKIYDLGASRLDPRMQRDQAALESRLANQGIQVGSEAYTNAMSDFNQGKNDAYNSLALSARGQASNEAIAQRQQGVSELGGLAGLGAQYGMGQTTGNFANVPQISVPGVNLIGLEQNRYNQEFQNYQQEMNNRNAMLGGISGLLGNAVGFGANVATGGSISGGLAGLGSGGFTGMQQGYAGMHNPSFWSPTVMGA